MDHLINQCDIDFDTGVVLWEDCRNPQMNGKAIGKTNRSGRRIKAVVGPKGVWEVNVARLIWYAHTGEHPECVDHINRDTLDDRIENLRGCTYAENRWNTVSGSWGQRWGVAGVGLTDALSWEVCLMCEGVQQGGTCYQSFADAVRARYALEDEFRGEFIPNLKRLNDRELKALETKHSQSIEGYKDRRSIQEGRRRGVWKPAGSAVMQSGVVGVTWKNSSWRARFRLKGVRYTSGGFREIGDAVAWIKAKRVEVSRL